MAHSKDSLEDQICRVLVGVYPDYIAAESIASEIGETRFKVETRIQRRLSQRRLCERITDNNGGFKYKASERLCKQYRDDKDSDMVHIEEHEGMECQEDVGMRLAGKMDAVASQTVMGSPRHGNKISILPLKVRPKSRAPSAMGPSYTAPTHVWPNVAPPPYYYPPQMHPAVVFSAGPMQQPMVYQPPPHMRVETPMPFPTSIYPPQPSKKSVLPVKVVPRDQGRREEHPIESKKSLISSDNGRFDGSLFPKGLWDHIPYETIMARIRTEDMEKLMARRFIPAESNKGLRSVDGLSKSVGAKPNGDGRGHAASPEPVKSLRSMGPPPPGFTRTPPDGRGSEETTDSRRRSMPPLNQERIPLENVSVPSSTSSSSSQ